MNENLDLTKILEGCPKGTEFYSSVWGKLIFERINCNPDCDYPIKFTNCSGKIVSLPKSGKYDYENTECIVFPSKDQRDWSKFERFWDKPKVEKFDPKTLQPFDKVLVRNEEQWGIDFFGHPLEDGYIMGIGWKWKQCIPYNDEIKHLVGTTDDCPEYYKWWEE